ncbi:uncharacterized protein BDZ83DRAFT_239095 [Colletotrichum acutatum]|uniref:Uncharacterized protein n=1 Tax=Glomerella acutata TaxID=27357 RepID=A0AAD8UNZ7_GLOAC|nr:uncharacterized protein BDZ83DRAFT_239095 [Colletotrichum acutatum]KAK1726858.1 hypothetical protein BDZ83DRAFT_239095 [Colletotrichum acutatum]
MEHPVPALPCYLMLSISSSLASVPHATLSPLSHRTLFFPTAFTSSHDSGSHQSVAVAVQDRMKTLSLILSNLLKAT